MRDFPSNPDPWSIIVFGFVFVFVFFWNEMKIEREKNMND